MKKILLLMTLFLTSVALRAQGFTPPAFGAYINAGSGWTPLTTGGSGAGQGFTPPPAALYVYSGGAWIPWTGSGGGGGAVNSVANGDGTLTVSPTTGSVVASLALGHANTWTGLQTMVGTNFTGIPLSTAVIGTLQAAQEPAHTGDVTNTAGSLALTIAANAVTGAKMANNTVTATQLAVQYSKGSCTEVWGGSGTSFALTSGDDAISNNTCYNDSGVTRTITAVKCRSDAAASTTTINPTFGAAGTGTTILSGALTCGSSLAYSSTGALTNTAWTTGTGVTPAMGGSLTGTSIAMIVEYTY